MTDVEFAAAQKALKAELDARKTEKAKEKADKADRKATKTAALVV
jgi:hypothetical protein